MAPLAQLLFSPRESSLIVRVAEETETPVYVVGLRTALMKLGVPSDASRWLADIIFNTEHPQDLREHLNSGYALVLSTLAEDGYWEMDDLEEETDDVEERLRRIDLDLRGDWVGLDFPEQYLNEFLRVFRGFLTRVANRYRENKAVSAEELLRDLVLIINENGDEHIYSMDTATTVRKLESFLEKEARYSEWLRDNKQDGQEA